MKFLQLLLGPAGVASLPKMDLLRFPQLSEPEEFSRLPRSSRLWSRKCGSKSDAANRIRRTTFRSQFFKPGLTGLLSCLSFLEDAISMTLLCQQASIAWSSSRELWSFYGSFRESPCGCSISMCCDGKYKRDWPQPFQSSLRL